MTITRGDTGDLQVLLRRIDGRGYGAYRELHGTWRVGDLDVEVTKVQSDPYAPPTRLDVRVPAVVASLDDDLWSTPARRRALEDHLSRRLRERCTETPFRVAAGGQEVLERTTCDVDVAGVRLRIAIELPDRRRRVRGGPVAAHLTSDLPRIVAEAVYARHLALDDARRHVATVEDAAHLRRRLPDLGLVAFVADGAVLPRRSGVDDRPLTGDAVVAFSSPPELRQEVDLPNRGAVSGLGVPEGVTLVVGGGFHGKSTLLRALERGVYDHVPGDGRELVVTRDDAVKIRAEDGRQVTRVDVSGFVGRLPTGDDTRDFSTANASGSTSQAANIVEALEAGSRLLLIDEDTSATNLMLRDLRMQQLIASDREPLTPFVDVVRPLYQGHGVSTVVVVGGSGDYFDVADHVVAMDAFRPRDVTQRARKIAADHPGRRPERTAFAPVRRRVPDPASVDPRRRGKVKTRARGTDALGFGTESIDLSAVEQLVEREQTDAVASALIRLVEDGHLDGHRTVAGALDALFGALESGGVQDLRGVYPGDLAMPRRFEVAAALNRLRSLRVTRLTGGDDD